MILELVALNSATVYLNRWDAIHAHDRVFELRPDGTAHEIEYDDVAQPHYMQVDLVAELRAMALATRGR